MKKSIFIILILFGFGLLYTSDTKALSETKNLQPEIASKLLRFHVVANSDSNSDQSVKILVKDNILNYLSPLLKNSSSLEDTKNIIHNNITSIENIARNTLTGENCNNSVSVNLEERFFPIKQYGDLTLPAGNYYALCVDIGNSAGKNWWCVMYPKLCFIDCTHSVIPDESKSQLHSVLTDEEYNSIFTNSNKSPKNSYYNRINFKFKILEFLQ